MKSMWIFVRWLILMRVSDLQRWDKTSPLPYTLEGNSGRPFICHHDENKDTLIQSLLVSSLWEQIKLTLHVSYNPDELIIHGIQMYSTSFLQSRWTNYIHKMQMYSSIFFTIKSSLSITSAYFFKHNDRWKF